MLLPFFFYTSPIMLEGSYSLHVSVFFSYCSLRVPSWELSMLVYSQEIQVFVTSSDLYWARGTEVWSLYQQGEQKT